MRGWAEVAATKAGSWPMPCQRQTSFVASRLRRCGNRPTRSPTVAPGRSSSGEGHGLLPIQSWSSPHRFSTVQRSPGSTHVAGSSRRTPAWRTGGCCHQSSRKGARSARGMSPRLMTYPCVRNCSISSGDSPSWSAPGGSRSGVSGNGRWAGGVSLKKADSGSSGGGAATSACGLVFVAGIGRVSKTVTALERSAGRNQGRPAVVCSHRISRSSSRPDKSRRASSTETTDTDRSSYR